MQRKAIIYLNLFASLSLFSLTACAPSDEEIAAAVKPMLQSQLDRGELHDYHMTVEKIDLIHDSGNKYQGIATVVENGQQHTVPLEILDDGKRVMFTVRPGAFAFVMADAIQRALGPTNGGSTASIASLLSREQAADEQCRGGSGDDPRTDAACKSRDELVAQLKTAGQCYGPEDVAESQKRWGPCP